MAQESLEIPRSAERCHQNKYFRFYIAAAILAILAMKFTPVATSMAVVWHLSHLPHVSSMHYETHVPLVASATSDSRTISLMSKNYMFLLDDTSVPPMPERPVNYDEYRDRYLTQMHASLQLEETLASPVGAWRCFAWHVPEDVFSEVCISQDRMTLVTFTTMREDQRARLPEILFTLKRK
jgi:hypothetical protein